MYIKLFVQTFAQQAAYANHACRVSLETYKNNKRNTCRNLLYYNPASN